MGDAGPLQALIKEHRVLGVVLNALDLEMQHLDGQPFPMESFRQALDFLTNFTHHWHLIKEEERLFPLLWEKGVPLENGPLGKLMAEHQTARNHLAAIRTHLEAAQKGDPGALTQLLSEVRVHVAFTREHMRKEEHGVFNVARTLLDQQDMERLAREFEEVEQEQIRLSFHEWHRV
ncbi:MAG: hemerythrin domain-containing protein [Acidobacteriia bacterium]|nr:hemerythrin domain-containing protein [Terriglobia bacterium]